MDSFNNLLVYIFAASPGRTFEYYAFVALLIAILIGLSFAIYWQVRYTSKDKIFKKLFRPFPGRLQIISFLLVLYLLSRYNYIPLLSMRIILYALLAWTLYIFYSLFITLTKTYPSIKNSQEQHKQKNKYLPRKKKNKHRK